jgi:hypothetical protein
MKKIIKKIKDKIFQAFRGVADNFFVFHKEAGFAKRATIWLLLCFFVLNFFTVFWGMPNAFSWSVDDPSGIFSIAFIKAEGSNYAPFGYIARLVSYLPFLGTYYIFGGWDLGAIKYPTFGFSNPDWQLGALLVSTRIFHFLMYIATVYFVYKITSFFNKKAAFWAALFYGFCPLVVEFSTYGNVDTPTMFFLAWGLYHLSSLFFFKGDENVARGFHWFGFFASLALVMGMKESVALSLVFPFLIVFVKSGYFSRQGIRRFFSEFLPGVLLFLIIIIVSNNLIFDFKRYYLHVARLVSHDSATNATYPMFPPVELAKRILESVLLVAPLSFVLFFLGWKNFFVKKYRFYSWFLLSLPISSFLLFACSFGRTYLRHNLPTILIFSVLSGLVFWQLTSKMKSGRRLIQFLVVVVLFSLALIPVRGKFTDSRYEAEKFISSIVKNKDVQVLSNRYHVYLPRLERMARSDDWQAKSIIFNSKINRTPNKDLYIVEYDKFDFYREAFKDYGVIYDSGPRYPYYHALDVRLSPCRISCRVLVLEKKSLGGVKGIRIEEDIKSYYDEELKKPDIYYNENDKQEDSDSDQ